MSGAPDNKPVAPGGFDPNFINSMLPDGTMLRFPKGTDPKIVDRVFREQLGQMQTQAQKPSTREIGTGEAAAIGGTQGLTFNFGDEIASGIAATIGRPGGESLPGKTWSERYDNGLNIARGVQGAAQEQHPVAYGAGEIAGAALPAVVAPELYGSRAIANAPTMASAALRSGGISAGLGFASGAGAGEGGALERAKSGAKTAAIAGPMGAALAPIARGFGARLPDPAIPTNDQLRTVGHAAYDMADNAGVVISPQALLRLRDTIQTDFANAGVDRELQARATRALARVTEAADSGEPITLRGLDVLRRVFARAGNTTDASEREFSGQAIDHIDDFIDRLSPPDMVQGDEQTAVPALQVARQVWSSLRKSETLDDLMNTAELQAASTNSGGNLQNTIRQKLRQVLTNPRLGRGFNEEERGAIEQIVRGNVTQNTLRTLGRLAPSSNSWLGILSTLSAGPAGALVPVVGAGAKAAADRSTQNAIVGLSDLVRGNAGVRIPNAAPPQIPANQAMARALMGTQAAVSGPGAAYANALLQPSTGGPR